MSRFALIIESSDVKGYSDLPGARDDARNWVNYLKSNLGGSWGDSEIQVLHKPYSSDVTDYLDRHKNDYCFVTFSGHGCHSEKQNQTYAVLNEHRTKCPIEILKPRGSKGALVFDACRWTEWEKQVMLEKKASVRTLTAANAAREIRVEHKAINFSGAVSRNEGYRWLSNLNASVSGVLVMYSCAIGEDADEFEIEDPADGGVYTTSLMGAARAWAGNYSTANVYSTKDAHDDAVSYMAIAYPQQHPVYEPGYLKFPFAVKS